MSAVISPLQPIRPMGPVDVDKVDGHDTALEHPGDAGIDVVWRDFAKVFFIGAMFFTAALYRFRKSITSAQS